MYKCYYLYGGDYYKDFTDGFLSKNISFKSRLKTSSTIKPA